MGSVFIRKTMGTVREDYSANGDAWNYITHDMSRSKAVRADESRNISAAESPGRYMQLVSILGVNNSIQLL